MGLTSILAAVMGMLTIAPQIIQLILQIEQIFQAAGINQGAGPAKKALLMSTVAASGLPEHMTNSVSALADGTVASFNSSGVFAKAK